MFSPCKPVRGFTLIELMLGIGVVAALVAIALPSYMSYRDKARSRQAAQEIAVMSTAIATYFNDVRSYPADLAAVGLGGKKDPWGRDYAYYNIYDNNTGQARKDRALNPINSDFDLYSLGPNGTYHVQVSNSRSLDDIIRARNGGFIGVAADF